jgi:hypothetical protein
MKYFHLLVIRGHDWPEKQNLVIFDHEPTKEEQESIIKEYWEKYEKGLYEEFDSFLHFLREGAKANRMLTDDMRAYKHGIWTEKVALINPKRKLLSRIWRWIAPPL